MRFTIKGLLVGTTLIAALLAFWMFGPREGAMAVVPFELIATLLTLVLITGAVIIWAAFRR